MTPSEKALYTHHPSDDILHSKHDIYKWDIDFSNIYARLADKTVVTTTREWEVVQITLAEMRINNTQWWQSKYTWDIFPSNWTENQIHQWYMNRNNTKWHWLPHWEINQKKRTRKNYVISPEVSPE